jgi:hypothetical protein
MFGGHGLFLDDAMFALIPCKEALFLKADEVNRPAYLERGRHSHGKMPYYAVPPEARIAGRRSSLGRPARWRQPCGPRNRRKQK